MVEAREQEPACVPDEYISPMLRLNELAHATVRLRVCVAFSHCLEILAWLHSVLIEGSCPYSLGDVNPLKVALLDARRGQCKRHCDGGEGRSETMTESLHNGL